MVIHQCKRCGGRLVFRRLIYHVKAKAMLPPPKGCRAWPIHLDGPCGQLLLPL